MMSAVERIVTSSCVSIDGRALCVFWPSAQDVLSRSPTLDAAALVQDTPRVAAADLQFAFPVLAFSSSARTSGYRYPWPLLLVELLLDVLHYVIRALRLRLESRPKAIHLLALHAEHAVHAVLDFLGIPVHASFGCAPSLRMPTLLVSVLPPTVALGSCPRPESTPAALIRTAPSDSCRGPSASRCSF